jgi:hypothetical protein
VRDVSDSEIPNKTKEVSVMADKTITCKDCGADFVFTENEQAFYKEKGFDNEPQRCSTCRAAKKQQIRNNRNNGNRY